MALRDYTNFFKKKYLTEDVEFTNDDGDVLKITLRTLNTKDGMLAESILDRLSLKSSENVPLSLSRVQSYNTQAVLAVSLFKVNNEIVEGGDFVGELYMQSKLRGQVFFEGETLTPDDIYERFILPRLEFLNNMPVQYLQKLMDVYNKLLEDLNGHLTGANGAEPGAEQFFPVEERDSNSSSKKTGKKSV